MGIFKKKEEIPTIPTASPLPSLPSISDDMSKRDLPELPSFPSSQKNANLNQEMVKSAVSDMPYPEEEQDIQIPENFTPSEDMVGEQMIPSRMSIQNSIPEIPKPIISAKPKEIKPQIPSSPIPELKPSISNVKQNEPIFVRIDKFQAAQKSFEEIKARAAEIESILQKIKEVKAREEEELKGWTEDAQKLKSQLAEIDSEIFNQL